MPGENQTKSTGQIFEEWEERYVSFNLDTPSRAPASSGMSISPYRCECLGRAKAVFPSVLVRSVFRAVFKAVMCFPSQT